MAEPVAPLRMVRVVAGLAVCLYLVLDALAVLVMRQEILPVMAMGVLVPAVAVTAPGTRMPGMVVMARLAT
jgi:hypothetical protein